MVLFHTEHSTSDEGVTKGEDVSALINSAVEQNSDCKTDDNAHEEKSLSKGIYLVSNNQSRFPLTSFYF